jgi:GntR family transcriptional regulator
MSLQRSPLHEQIADFLRTEIREGRYKPGDRLPSERELSERFKVSKVTARWAIVQLRSEGLVTSRMGSGVFVAKKGPPRRLSDDTLRGEVYRKAIERLGLQSELTTTITREPANEEVAEALDVEVGAEVLIHAQVVGTEGGPPLVLANNHFPLWVVEAVPQLEDESTVGIPKWLGDEYGPLWGEDVIDSRMPTEQERERLQIPEGVPVTVIQGVNRDAQHRPLHYIVKITPSGSMLYSYRFGVVPES